jgi:hypothetical protein
MGFKEAKLEIEARFNINIDNFKTSLKGSKVKKSDISKFKPSDLCEGMQIEFEHTTDAMVALEIALAHLNERKDYYYKLKKYVEKD